MPTLNKKEIEAEFPHASDCSCFTRTQDLNEIIEWVKGEKEVNPEWKDRNGEVRTYNGKEYEKYGRSKINDFIDNLVAHLTTLKEKI